MTRALPLGVDLGRARICVALAERGPDGAPHLIAAVSRPTGANAAATLAGMRAELGTRERRCVLALGAPDSLVREVVFPPLCRREREGAARFEVARFVPYALDETVVRLLSLAAGRQAVAVARQAALEHALQVARRARLRAIAVDDTAFALLRAFDADVIVDVGLTGSTCIVRDEPLPTVRVLTLGGQALTDAIVAALGIDSVTAEQRKRSIGLAGAGEPVRDAAMNAPRDTVARALALAALTVLVAGYALGARGEEQRIAAQLNQNGSTAERADDALRSLAERPALEAERRRLRERLRRTDLGEDAARLVARFLRGAASTAERHGAAVVSVDAGDAAHPLDAQRDAIPLALELDGSYRAILDAIADLSRLGVPASVDVVSLARTHADGPDRTLTAALRVSLLRLAAEDHPGARAAPH